MTHIHPTYDNDKRVVINGITRDVVVSDANKPVLIQYDNNSEVVTFEVDRYVEGHDLALSNKVEVHYNNLDTAGRRSSKGLYEATDLRVNPDNKTTVLVSWYISDKATQYEGSLNFVLSFSCLEDDVYNVYRWNSHIATFYVSAGINNTDYLENTYADVLEMWKQTLFGIGDTEEASMIAMSETQQMLIERVGEEVIMAAEEAKDLLDEKAKQLLATIPDTSEELQKTVNELLESDYIPKTTIDGNVITETYNDGHKRVTTIDGDTVTENWYTAAGVLYKTNVIAISQNGVTENMTTV